MSAATRHTVWLVAQLHGAPHHTVICSYHNIDIACNIQWPNLSLFSNLQIVHWCHLCSCSLMQADRNISPHWTPFECPLLTLLSTTAALTHWAVGFYPAELTLAGSVHPPLLMQALSMSMDGTAALLDCPPGAIPALVKLLQQLPASQDVHAAVAAMQCLANLTRAKKGVYAALQAQLPLCIVNTVTEVSLKLMATFHSTLTYIVCCACKGRTR